MITSINNEKIKYFLKLKEKKFCKDSKLCLVESIKLVRQLYEQGLLKTLILLEEKANLVDDFQGVDYEIVSSAVLKVLSDSVTPDGVMAVCQIPECSTLKWNKCLILDRIQDPSNLGAIVRSATAFGFDTILAINSVYPYSYKAIRSSMGYIFKINFLEVSPSELEKIKQAHNLKIITADMSGKNIKDFKKPSGNIALVIGNEGQGVSRELKNLSDASVSIQMQNNVESLNASVSASILMYLL